MSAPPGAPEAVGLVGVGHMGGAMAENLLARGWRVAVCDLDAVKVQRLQEKGADPSANPCQVAIKNDVTIVCVVDAAQTEDVLFCPHGIVHGARAGHTVLLCPTIAPEDVERFAARLAAQGIHTPEAPMSPCWPRTPAWPVRHPARAVSDRATHERDSGPHGPGSRGCPGAGLRRHVSADPTGETTRLIAAAANVHRAIGRGGFWPCLQCPHDLPRTHPGAARHGAGAAARTLWPR